MNPPSLPPFSERLLQWWDQHGRQNLPWQHPRTAYRVWISEIMLQQTQVATVIPYFQRWMKAMPDMAKLAQSPVDAVLSLWSGLGYYARARNLHRTAQICVSDHGGVLPQEAEYLSALPGIGLSTANAIISQSTDQPAAVLDGNVRRLLARHAGIAGWTGQARVQKLLWQQARARLPKERGADYTQAVMDLGALICTRSRPACDSCPVAVDCQALLHNQVQQLPSPKPPAKVSHRTVYLMIVRDRAGRVLLEKRPPSGIWGGLWSLPEGDSIESIETEMGLADTRPVTLPEFQHRLSHVRMLLRPVTATVTETGQVKCSREQGWFTPAESASLGLPKPIAELLAACRD